MRIYFGDLCYLHDWDNNQPVPLNVGYIAAYLKTAAPDLTVEIFKDPRTLADKISSSPPDILALSHYDWNANLNLTLLRHAKRVAPDTIAVMGGPNFEAGDREWVRDFFAQRQELDLYITGEGEWSFARLIALLGANEGALDKIPHEDLPSSFYLFDRASGEVIRNPANPVSRLDLSTVPSPYLMGLMDPFLQDMRLAPIIETNRGCPYSCTFCCWGQATQSKVNRFSLETVIEEIRYIASKTKNPSGFFYIADGNFGILKRDLEIASVIQECSEQHGFPKRVFIYFAKNTNESVINIAEKLSAVTSMSMSKQSLNKDVLENIKRENIPVEQYDKLRVECEKRGIDTFCELIYGLAGESYQSYVDGVIATVRNRHRVAMYPQMLIAGAESNSVEYREKFGIRTAFRIIPRYVSSYGDIHSLEYEELVIETDAMSRDDFFRIRMYQFLCFVLGSEMFSEFNRGLEVLDLDYASLADRIAKDEQGWSPLWRNILEAHRESSRNELLTKEQVKLEFTAEDIKEVNANQLALNPYYMATILSSTAIVADLRGYLLEAVERFYGARFVESDLEEIKAALDLSFDKIVRYDEPAPEKFIEYEYDVDAWLTSENVLPLSDFRLKKPVQYRFRLDDDILPMMAKATEDTGEIAHALYRIRTNVIGPAGDRIYCYRRNPASLVASAKSTQAEDKLARREAARRHSEVASRLS